MTQSSPMPVANARYLTGYYGIRALFSASWVGLALMAGRTSSPFATLLLLAYPAWDCVANLYDARHNGGLRRNPTQAFNALVSAIVTVAVGVAVMRDYHDVLLVIGLWALLAGLLQLATALRRWRGASAQWPMILSGAQSMLAGTHFLSKGFDPTLSAGVSDIAPYAAFGAFYFALSTVSLVIASTHKTRRHA